MWLRQLYHTACFLVLLVAPKMYKVMFNFEKFTLFANMQSLLVRLGVFRAPEQLATALVFNVGLLVAYWVPAVAALATGQPGALPNECVSVDPQSPAVLPPYKCVGSARNLFVHAVLPVDTCVTCLLQASATFSDRRAATLLSVLFAAAFGIIQVLRPTSPPPQGAFEFVARTQEPLARRFLYVLLVVPAGAVQWGAHSLYDWWS
jgi:hypothetical protein